MLLLVRLHMPVDAGAVKAGEAIGWPVAIHHGTGVRVRDDAEHWE